MGVGGARRTGSAAGALLERVTVNARAGTEEGRKFVLSALEGLGALRDRSVVLQLADLLAEYREDDELRSALQQAIERIGA